MPSIGAPPTSGINFGRQRARSNQVSVDGADAVDNSTNGIRSTVSQEAVQEFQLTISNYMPEFGRATGGVQMAATVAFLSGSASSVALNAVDYGAIATAYGVPTLPGPRFPVPIDCNPLAVPPVGCSAANLVSLPKSFVPLDSLIGNYPISEGTSLWSARLDHQRNDRNNSWRFSCSSTTQL